MTPTAENELFPKLVARIKKGDTHALGEVIELTQRRLFRHCFHLCGDEMKAEELAQDVYLRAFDLIGKLPDPKGLLSWLFTIARRMFIDQTRSAEYKIEKLASHETEEFPLLERIPSETSAGASDEARLVQAALLQMKPEDRQLLLLVYQEGYSGEEAAKILGISAGALRVRIHRAKAAFAHFYQEVQARTDREAK